jgi:predicted protein tyrosine phosphatase
MKLLFVCTHNAARSRMAEAICRELAGKAAGEATGAGHEVRSAGTGSGAGRRLTTRDLAWADVVAVMEREHLEHVRRHWPHHAKKVRVLDVPDDYVPGEPVLREVLIVKVQALLEELAGR